MKRTQAEIDAARVLLAEVEQEERELLMELAATEARDDLLGFTRYMRPDPDAPDDPRRSQYEVHAVHNLLATVLERIEQGLEKRVIFTLPPRTGKTELASHKFPAWFIGRNPTRSVIVATYNGVFAGDFGLAINGVLKSERFAQVFPEAHLLGNARSSSRMTFAEGGSIFCIGRGNSATGRGADLFIMDDLIKDAKEARSPVVRDAVWDWFTKVAMTRLMSKDGRVIIIMTRWNEDDLVGRLTDPNNQHYNPVEAARWTVINVPALAEDNDVLGRKRGEVLWPERFPKEFLLEHQARDPQGFNALYQGRPAPEEGTFFKQAHIKTYTPRERPENLRYYITSDHAVGITDRSNKTCMIVAGVDKDLHLWIVDVVWRKMDTEAATESMIKLIDRYRPQNWTAELGHISKSIGPFLRRRMREENIACYINEVHPSKDKQVRAQPIQARMSMGSVHFPSNAWWLADAKRELLQFPNSGEDDFVDALALFGIQLDAMVGPGRRGSRDTRNLPRMNTLEWVKASAEARRRIDLMQTRQAGW